MPISLILTYNNHIFCKFNSIFVILQVDLSASIEEAFGFNGLGLLTVRGVPELVSLRATILPLVRKCVAAIFYFVPIPCSLVSFAFSRLITGPNFLIDRFATLPEEIKDKTAHKESVYSFGWSHGREVLEGKPDFSKGSYYNNPVYNRPFEGNEITISQFLKSN